MVERFERLKGLKGWMVERSERLNEGGWLVVGCWLVDCCLIRHLSFVVRRCRELVFGMNGGWVLCGAWQWR